jgi:hypothetical protein
MSSLSRFRSNIAVVLAVAWSVFSTSARAARGDEDSLIRQGVESRRRQHDAEALDFFRNAYELNHSPRAAAQMGLAELALGRWVASEAHLEEAIASSADPWVAKHLAMLKESLDRVRQRVGELEILGGPPLATIAIEGVVVGTLPLSKPIRVRSGDCRFVVTAPGYEPTTRTVDVSPGRLTRETVSLSKVASSPAQATNDADTSARQVTVESDQARVAVREPGARDASAPTTVTNSPQPTESAAPSYLPTVGIVLTSAGVAALGAGVFFSVKTRSAGQDASDSGTFDPDADSAGRRYQTLQYVAYGVGAALVAGGITAFVLGSNRTPDRGATQVAIIPSSGGGSAFLTCRF